jgi:hypothetical protein
LPLLARLGITFPAVDFWAGLAQNSQKSPRFAPSELSGVASAESVRIDRIVIGIIAEPVNGKRMVASRRKATRLGAHHILQAPETNGAQHQMEASGATSLDPLRLAEWSELHEQISRLPDDPREQFDLLWYGSLSQEEAAELLQLNRQTQQHFNREGPHSAREHLPLGCEKAPEPPAPLKFGGVDCTRRLGGHLKAYSRRAA